MKNCSHCGTQNSDNDLYCNNCGSLLENQSYQRPNNAYQPVYVSNGGQIAFSIIVLLCCCQLFGIIALIFAATAPSQPTQELANQKLKTANTLNILGLIFGIIVGIIVVILALSGAFEGYYYYY